MQLSDLHIRIGRLARGSANAITDVPGVRVGHAEAADGSVGLTLVQPFADGEPRRTYLGRWALDGGDDATGLGLAQDFGALSTPLIMAPAPAAGRVYDAMIQRGLQLDAGLSEDRGWPPAVIPMDGVGGAALAIRSVVDDAMVQAAFDSAKGGAVAQGRVGIGRSLIGFGCAAGVGTASRRVGGHTVGVLIAVNGGEPDRFRVAGHDLHLAMDPVEPGRPRAVIAAVMTDAALLPHQLDRIAGRGSFGLTRVGLLDEWTRSATIWALSTRAPIDVLDAATATIDAGGVGEERLPSLYAAAADALEEAVVNALLAGSQNPGTAQALPLDGWPDRIRAAQRGNR